MEQTLYEAHAKLSQTHWWFEGRRAVLGEVMRLLGWKSQSGNDLEPGSRLLNAVLRTVFSAERFVVPHTTLPFGVSLVAVASAR